MNFAIIEMLTHLKRMDIEIKTTPNRKLTIKFMQYFFCYCFCLVALAVVVIIVDVIVILAVGSFVDVRCRFMQRYHYRNLGIYFELQHKLLIAGSI